VSRFIYCYAECHYAECRYAECQGADKTNNAIVAVVVISASKYAPVNDPLKIKMS
jgi:hypothetical protein